MMCIHRENETDPDTEFTIDFSQDPDGRHRCRVQRGGGTVSLSGGPFKTLSTARVWSRLVVTGLLRADLLCDQVAAALAFRGPAAAELEGEVPCIHCGHTDGVHRVDGDCGAVDQVAGSSMRCPCTWFEGEAVR